MLTFVSMTSTMRFAKPQISFQYVSLNKMQSSGLCKPPARTQSGSGADADLRQHDEYDAFC
ncbi:MAG: hypothetical protein ABI723_13040 [Bacteroidia bacterium]